MDARIVIALVAVAFVTGIMINSTDLYAAKGPSKSDIPGYSKIILENTLRHIQLTNDFFQPPPEEGISYDDREIQILLDEIKEEHETFGNRIVVWSQSAAGE